VEVVWLGIFVCPQVFSFFRFNLPNKPNVAVAVGVALTLVRATGADAAVLINELYYDHPGGDDGYEFIELINVSDLAVPVADVSIEFHNGTGVGWESLWSGGDGEIAPGGLFVAGGRFVSPPPDDVAGFSVQNGPDAVRVTVAGEQTDLVAYGSLDDGVYAEGKSAPGAPAGRSLGRRPDGEDTDDNAADFAVLVPSPGAYNVARYDAGITVAGDTRLRTVLGVGEGERVVLSVVNNGLHELPSGGVSVDVRDSTLAGSTPLARSDNEQPLAPGGSVTMAFDVTLSPGYHWLCARVEYAADERAFNDDVTLLRRVGGPSLLVSEVLCYPRDGCPQFVEFFNAGRTAADVTGFKLRDRSHALTTITDSAVEVAPGGYVVVTEDSEALRRYFPSAPMERVIGHAGTWPTLNRTGSGGESDSVVLADALSLPVDAVAYPPMDTDHEGRSLERVDLFGGRTTQTWVLSEDPEGASPGRRNRRSLFSPPPPGTIEVSPRTFSPRTGETMTVLVDADPGFRVVVGVYDVEGRWVAGLGSATAFPAVFVWGGRDGNGRDVEPGLYIVVCESFDGPGRRVATQKVVVGCGRRGE